MHNFTPEEQVTLTRATMSILDSWKLGVDDMREMLGLPETVRARSFQKFRSHEAFPDSPEVMRRVDYVMRIAGALHTTYPSSPQMRERWLRQPHRRFGRAPLALMVRGGEDGLIQVLAELDCTFGWEMMSKRA